MREIAAEEVSRVVAELCVRASRRPTKGVVEALERAARAETHPLGRTVLEDILENDRIALEDDVPLCQDTGAVVVLVDWGQDARLVGGELQEAVDTGVREGTERGLLRRSIVRDPLRRVNTGDNTPAFVHVRLVGGDGVRITVGLKGAGSENCSALAMLTPGDGVEGAREFMLSTVKRAGGKPCPPLVVGVGIGGTFDSCAALAKRAAFRPVGVPNADPFYAELEREWLEAVNALGVGPGGLGGAATALAVNIEAAPCHIASLPVAVNINCHAARVEAAEL